MWACLCIPRYIHCKVYVAHRHTPMSRLVSCSFSTIPICPFLIQRIFHLLVSALFILAFRKFLHERLYVFLTLHAPSIIMNAFLLSCVFSVENQMPGGYWSRTGTADLSGALLHHKNSNCAMQEYPRRGRDRDMGSITLTKS